MSIPDLSVVIPAFNEVCRLPRTLNEIDQTIRQGVLPSALEVIIVDDGSTDGTVLWVQGQKEAVSYPLSVYSLGRNRGKGAAIVAGLRVAKGERVLVADADASTPFDEYQSLLATQTDIAIASRGLPRSQIVVRQPGCRHALGRVFNRVVRWVSGLPYFDTQCGFKLFSRKAAQVIVQTTRVENFAWDIEMLMSAKRHRITIAEVPVRWEHREDSRVRMWRHGVEMVWTVFRMRMRVACRWGAGKGTRMSIPEVEKSVQQGELHR